LPGAIPTTPRSLHFDEIAERTALFRDVGSSKGAIVLVDVDSGSVSDFSFTSIYILNSLVRDSAMVYDNINHKREIAANLAFTSSPFPDPPYLLAKKNPQRKHKVKERVKI
jgi:hypothetical protein